MKRAAASAHFPDRDPLTAPVFSEGLLAAAHLTDHIAVLRGRFAAAHLKAFEPPLADSA